VTGVTRYRDGHHPDGCFSHRPTPSRKSLHASVLPKHNFMKVDLYRPLLRCQEKYRMTGFTWHRGGDIRYVALTA